MEQILELFKNYFGIAFILLIFSYLSPKESYRKYFQFFISVLIAVILFEPLAERFLLKRRGSMGGDWRKLEERLNEVQYNKQMEEDIFECFGMENNTEQVEEPKAR